MQSKTRTKVHECADLPWRYRSFKHIAVPKFSKVEGGIKDVPLVEDAHPSGNLSVRQFVADWIWGL
jgi:hypothetical protein